RIVGPVRIELRCGKDCPRVAVAKEDRRVAEPSEVVTCLENVPPFVSNDPDAGAGHAERDNGRYPQRGGYDDVGVLRRPTKGRRDHGSTVYASNAKWWYRFGPSDCVTNVTRWVPERHRRVSTLSARYPTMGRN